jgi:DNA-binding NarL/FixJ family response regulator
MRILVADDHEVMRKGVCAILSAGFSFAICDEASNGQEAVEKACRHRPDIVILDISMPVLGGFAAAKEIHQHMPDVPILLFTSNPSEQFLSEAKKTSAQGIVSKEQAANTLVMAVKALLRKETFFLPIKEPEE